MSSVSNTVDKITKTQASLPIGCSANSLSGEFYTAETPKLGIKDTYRKSGMPYTVAFMVFGDSAFVFENDLDKGRGKVTSENIRDGPKGPGHPGLNGKLKERIIGLGMSPMAAEYVFHEYHVLGKKPLLGIEPVLSSECESADHKLRVTKNVLEGVKKYGYLGNIRNWETSDVDTAEGTCMIQLQNKKTNEMICLTQQNIVYTKGAGNMVDILLNSELYSNFSVRDDYRWKR